MATGSKHVVILGGGVGGQVVANELRRRIPEEHRITVVERQTQHAFAPSFLWVMTDTRRPERVARDVRGRLRRGIDFVRAEVTRIDVAARSVATTGPTIAYDRLVIALGAELAPERIPGLSEAAHTFYTLDGAVRLREGLEALNEGTIAIVVSALPYKCPAAPYEAAMLMADFFRRHGRRRQVDIHVFTPESQPMPVGGPALGKAVHGMLAERDISFHPLHALTAVQPASRTLAFEGMTPIPYDLLVAIPPHRAPLFLRDAGITNEAGWIPVDPRTLVTRHEGIYALGDVTAIPIPGRWTREVPLPLPKAGVFAHAEALVVARRLAADIAGIAPADTDTFRGNGFCMLEAGGGRAGIAFGNFFAEPAPNVQAGRVGRAWHIGKVLFEQWSLAPRGLRRAALAFSLRLGGKLTSIRMEL